MRMSEMVAVVTGASSGIGKAIYEHLKDRRGMRVVGVSRRGPDVMIDLTLIDIHSKDFAPLLDCDCSLLVNCAGMLSFDEQEVAQDIFELNFWAPYRMMLMFEQPLFKSRGSVINIASISGMMPEPEEPIYGASKAALISLTISFALRWAPEIRVNAISPGFVESNLVPGDTPQHLIDPIPLKFEAKPSMLLPAVDYLIDCPYVTGENLVVDGGLLLRRGGK